MKQASRLATLVLVTSTFASEVLAGEYINKAGITMVDIPNGSYVMGSCKQQGMTQEQQEENKKRAFLGQALTQEARNDCLAGSPDPEAADNETPQRQVTIKAFQMSRTEVTLAQFKKFIVAAGRNDLVSDDFIKHNKYGENAPVTMVSWNDAQDFIKWLNQTEGGGYRLPSEAEWEYACRAGGQHRYCGGNELNTLGWYGNKIPRQQPVGGKRSNAFGLYDMSGNVWEWVQDCVYDRKFDDEPTDGSAYTNGSCVNRGLRGGSWANSASASRAANRYGIAPNHRYIYYGIRLARTL